MQFRTSIIAVFVLMMSFASTFAAPLPAPPEDGQSTPGASSSGPSNPPPQGAASSALALPASGPRLTHKQISKGTAKGALACVGLGAEIVLSGCEKGVGVGEAVLGAHLPGRLIGSAAVGALALPVGAAVATVGPVAMGTIGVVTHGVLAGKQIKAKVKGRKGGRSDPNQGSG